MAGTAGRPKLGNQNWNASGCWEKLKLHEEMDYPGKRHRQMPKGIPWEQRQRRQEKRLRRNTKQRLSHKIAVSLVVFGGTGVITHTNVY